MLVRCWEEFDGEEYEFNCEDEPEENEDDPGEVPPGTGGPKAKWSKKKCRDEAGKLLGKANEVLGFRSAIQVFADTIANAELGNLFREAVQINIDNYKKNDSLGQAYDGLRFGFYGIGVLVRQNVLGPHGAGAPTLDTFNADAADARKAYEDNKQLASDIKKNCEATKGVKKALEQFGLAGFIGATLEAIAGNPFPNP